MLEHTLCHLVLILLGEWIEFKLHHKTHKPLVANYLVGIKLVSMFFFA